MSNDEHVVRPTVLREISHSYPDGLPSPGTVRCYAFEELFAEKLRALGERGRPRDLYDVILLHRRPDLRGHPELIRDTLHAKCATKGVAPPTIQLLTASEARVELEAEWENMLGHQLPVLPPFEHVFDELPRLFDWLSGASAPEEELESIAIGGNEDADWTPPPLAATWKTGVPLEVVRFAAANHLCVELEYQNRTRIIEPYSLRRTRDGNLLLYGVKVASGALRAYRVDRIQGVRATRQPFRPRVAVELTPQGPLLAPPTHRRGGSAGQTTLSQARWTVVCLACGRRFPRKSRNSRLRPHQDRSGFPCGGPRGRFL